MRFCSTTAVISGRFEKLRVLFMMFQDITLTMKDFESIIFLRINSYNCNKLYQLIITITCKKYFILLISNISHFYYFTPKYCYNITFISSMTFFFPFYLLFFPVYQELLLLNDILKTAII